MKIDKHFIPRELKNVKGISVNTTTSQAKTPGFDFMPGQIFKGKVLSQAPDGKVLLDINGQNVEANSKVPLKPGSEFWFEVKQDKPMPWLVLAEKKGAGQELLQRLLGDNAAMEKAYRLLFASPMQEAVPADKLPPQLQALLASGLGGEASTQRLAGLLALMGLNRSGGDLVGPMQRLVVELTLLAKGELNEAERAALNSLNKFASLLELQQQVNSLPPGTGQSLFLLLPCFFAMGAGWGEWLYSQDSESGPDGQAGENFSLSFFLNMSKLGELQMQLTVRGKNVQGELVLNDEAAKRHMESRLPELSEILQRLGYDSVSLQCRTGRTALLQSLKEAVEEVSGLRPVSIVDIKA